MKLAAVKVPLNVLQPDRLSFNDEGDVKSVAEKSAMVSVLRSRLPETSGAWPLH